MNQPKKPASNPPGVLRISVSNFTERHVEQKKSMPIGKREKQVLLHVAMGESTSTISENLCISIRTVETHRKNLLKKLGAKNTANLIYRAMSLGLL